MADLYEKYKDLGTLGVEEIHVLKDLGFADEEIEDILDVYIRFIAVNMMIQDRMEIRENEKRAES